MKNVLISLVVLGGLYGVPFILVAEKLACVCTDGTHKEPDCGICGSLAGTMEKTKDGVACMCFNMLKLKELSCPEVCKAHGGWKGEIV